jgi:hypothetical protein
MSFGMSAMKTDDQKWLDIEIRQTLDIEEIYEFPESNSDDPMPGFFSIWSLHKRAR